MKTWKLLASLPFLFRWWKNKALTIKGFGTASVYWTHNSVYWTYNSVYWTYNSVYWTYNSVYWTYNSVYVLTAIPMIIDEY